MNLLLLIQTKLLFSLCVLPRGEMTKLEFEEFESRLNHDQQARDALAEAVRLSARALGQIPPKPSCSIRKLIRNRLKSASDSSGACVARSFYWTGKLRLAIAVATTIFVILLVSNSFEPKQTPIAPVQLNSTTLTSNSNSSLATPSQIIQDVVPINIELSPATSADDHVAREAEIWAELSTPKHIDRTHEDEARLRQKLRDLQSDHATSRSSSGLDE